MSEKPKITRCPVCKYHIYVRDEDGQSGVDSVQYKVQVHLPGGKMAWVPTGNGTIRPSHFCINALRVREIGDGVNPVSLDALMLMWYINEAYQRTPRASRFDRTPRRIWKTGNINYADQIGFRVIEGNEVGEVQEQINGLMKDTQSLFMDRLNELGYSTLAELDALPEDQRYDILEKITMVREHAPDLVGNPTAETRPWVPKPEDVYKTINSWLWDEGCEHGARIFGRDDNDLGIRVTGRVI
jgi:hypothetical protein